MTTSAGSPEAISPAAGIQPLVTTIAPGGAQSVGRWRIESRSLTIADRSVGGTMIRSATASDPQPADWVDRLAAFFTLDPAIVSVGAKRLMPDGHVQAMGEFVIHPKGFHHHGQGVDGRCYRFAEEVDLITGGVLLVRTGAFEAAVERIGGFRALEGDLGLIELGLALRLAGGRAFAVPQVITTDAFTPEPSAEQTAAFVERWGFDWRLPDIDAVREQYAGSGLLWNAKYLAPAMPFEKYRDRGALVWESYAKADVFRQRAHHLAEIAARFAVVNGTKGRVLDLGCGDGFFSHLFALKGLEVTGIDPEDLGIDQARLMTKSQSYPASAPTFQVATGTRLPFEDASFSLVTNLDVIEHLQNPVQVIREAARVLKSGGHFLVVTPSWQFGGSSDAVYHGFEYTMEELVRTLRAVDQFEIADTGMIKGVYRDLVVIARKRLA